MFWTRSQQTFCPVMADNVAADIGGLFHMSADHILNAVAEFYLASDDFNGVPLDRLAPALQMDLAELRSQLVPLIHADLLAVLTELDGNPHILSTGFPDVATQVDRLSSNPSHTCIYPRPSVLTPRVDRSRFQSTPYTLRMALGEPQLAYQAFDLAVLEFYRNDPRYTYYVNDMAGRICVKDEFFQSDSMAEHDQVLLQTFGFAYDDDMNRTVAVFLRYLADLSPEHQQIWKAKELAGDYMLHPDYFESSYYGNWPTNVSIFDAYLMELCIINQMSEAMGRPPLFRRDFGRALEGKPARLSFLIRPTCVEFNAFVLLLDKLLSDNINVKFFEDDVPTETEVERDDGKIEVQRKGTIQILNDWVRSVFRTDDWAPWDAGIAAMKQVRKLRQSPAHAVNDNEFDQRFFKEQRELMLAAYKAVRTIRLLLANHSVVAAANIDIPKAIREGHIFSR